MDKKIKFSVKTVSHCCDHEIQPRSLKVVCMGKSSMSIIIMQILTFVIFIVSEKITTYRHWSLHRPTFFLRVRNWGGEGRYHIIVWTLLCQKLQIIIVINTFKYLYRQYYVLSKADKSLTNSHPFYITILIFQAARFFVRKQKSKCNAQKKVE